MRRSRSLIDSEVSIPQSEFCPLGLTPRRLSRIVPGEFQFLSRNSVRWDFNTVISRQLSQAVVSIPQSEFCPLGLAIAIRKACLRSMFQFLSRNSVRWDQARAQETGLSVERFNSSVGILSVGTKKCRRQSLRLPCFNSSVGILSVGTWLTSVHAPILLPCFNSSVGILSVGTTIPVSIHATDDATFQFLSRNSVRWDLTLNFSKTPTH